MAYIPALDGIRTLAVAAVVLYHLSPNLAPGGMQGVTIFFVLSGYLITRLLLSEYDGTGAHRPQGRSGSVAYADSSRRSSRSLWRAAALCTLFNHVMLTKMRPDIIPSALFLNNWWQIFNQQSYFNAVGDPSPLTHFWSPAIEMQFYLVWPVALMFALRAGQPQRRIGRAALALAAVSAIEMAVLYNPGADPSCIYYGTDTRAFSCFWRLACVCPQRAAHAGRTGSMAGRRAQTQPRGAQASRRGPARRTRSPRPCRPAAARRLQQRLYRLPLPRRHPARIAIHADGRRRVRAGA
ncbi:MAG: acyltransferase family protein [Collinsella sp.]